MKDENGYRSPKNAKQKAAEEIINGYNRDNPEKPLAIVSLRYPPTQRSIRIQNFDLVIFKNPIHGQPFKGWVIGMEIEITGVPLPFAWRRIKVHRCPFEMGLREAAEKTANPFPVEFGFFPFNPSKPMPSVLGVFDAYVTDFPDALPLGCSPLAPNLSTHPV